MGKPKNNRDDKILEQQKLRQQRRRDKIKSDPILYAQYKANERRRYYKRKSEGKILPISQETPARKNLLRNRNRKNFRAYYIRQKENKVLETIEEEPEVCMNLALNDEIDPLVISPVPCKSRYKLRSNRKLPSSADKNDDEALESHKTVSETEFHASCSTLHVHPSLAGQKSARKTSTPTQDPLLETDTLRGNISDDLSSICSPSFPHTLERNSSRSSIASSSSESKILTPKRKIKSPHKLAIKRLKYKTNKQIKILNSKINKLKLLNESYRKKLSRLQRKTYTKNEVNKENLDQKNTTVNLITEEKIKNVKHDIEVFLEQDENSRICPGKKEYITKKKIKKQKRFLTETLQNLHNKFIRSVPYKISYSSFCRMRPFWILVPDVRARETCMCKTHSNMDLMVSALYRFNLINESTVHKMLCSICCDPTNVECLTRKCLQCINKAPFLKEFDNSKEIFYMHWTSKKQQFVKDGKERTCNKIIKDKIVASPKQVIDKFQIMLHPYMNHRANIIVQNGFIKRLKSNLNENEAIVHVDYSENYNTKYTTEIQSFHFAGSRRQLTLHTVVIYYKKNTNLVTQSFCTVSESLRHDAVAVWEHLMPILKHIDTEVPYVRAIHFISDSPTGQYRNKKMFYVISELHRDYPHLQFLSWNYTESGHGKGAPDGVGAVIKRTADRLVAQGNDIVDIDSFMDHLKTNTRGVLLELVDESGILQKDLLFPAKLPEFKGTMKVHQVVWSSEQPDILAMRRLSCDLNDCLLRPLQCIHGHHIGFYKILNGYEENVNPKLTLTDKVCDKIEITPNTVSSSSNKIQILSSVVIHPKNDAEIFSKPVQNHKSVKKNGQDTTGNDLELPDNDSFWAPVSPVNFTIAEPSFSNNNDESDGSEEYNIFDLKK